jgi:hypothetical protein
MATVLSAGTYTSGVSFLLAEVFSFAQPIHLGQVVVRTSSRAKPGRAEAIRRTLDVIMPAIPTICLRKLYHVTIKI